MFRCLSWRAVFWLNVPVAALAVVLTLRHLHLSAVIASAAFFTGASLALSAGRRQARAQETVRRTPEGVRRTDVQCW